MTIVRDAGVSLKTPYPFGFSKRAYDLAIQNIPTRDLRAEIEAAQWLALDVADVEGDSHAVAEIQLTGLLDERDRRKRLWTARAADPLRPAWPRSDGDLKNRVEAVKAAWPIERFCDQVLAAQLQPAGRNRLKARCPLPGHDDRTPSFTVFISEERAWCFGCNRGGDIVALTGYAFGDDRFYERLERLERFAGIAHRVAS